MLCGATAKNSDYDRFSRFFSLLLPFLIIYAALIDDRAACSYNKSMEQPVNEELYTETVEPAKRFIRSDVALYVLVVVLLCFPLTDLTTLAYDKWQESKRSRDRLFETMMERRKK